MGFWPLSPLISVVWGSERVQASDALPRRWLAHITASSSERHPHPHRQIAPHQRRGRLDERGVHIGQPIRQVVTLQVHLTTRPKPPSNGLPRHALRAMYSRSCWAAMPSAKCSSPNGARLPWPGRKNTSISAWMPTWWAYSKTAVRAGKHASTTCCANVRLKKTLVTRSGRSMFLAAGRQTSISAACY